MGTPNNVLFDQGLFGGPLPTSSGVTVLRLLLQAYRIAHILKAPERGLSPEQITEGRDVMNALLDQWNTQRLTIFAIRRYVETIQASQQDYYIGIDATDPEPSHAVWSDIPRPERVEMAGMILQSNQPTPLELPMTMLTIEQWKDIPLKQTNSTFPLWAYYEPTFPFGILHTWPVPQQGNQIALYLWQQISQLPATNDTALIFPPGYQKVLQYWTAMELCIRWGMPVPPDTRLEAQQAMAWVKSINAPIIDAICDPAVQSDGRNRVFNWITGDWQRR